MSNPMRWLRRGWLVAAACVVALPAAAQQGSIIRGVLKVSTSGAPIAGARVSLVGTSFLVETDGKGEFEFPALVPGRYVVRAAAIGYATITSPVDLKSRQTVDMEFHTEVEAARLPELTVEERSTHGPMDWLRRKSEGRGKYISRDDIDRGRAATLPDALRMVPGVRIDCRGGAGNACFVRMTRAPRGCNPAFFMDGIPTDPVVAYLTPVQEVEGVEIYSGPADTPPELESFQARCGVVVIWTRSPPPRRPRDKKNRPPIVTDSLVPPSDTLAR